MKLSPDQKAGILITAIFHLAVIIVFLAVQIGFQVKKENSFVLDFTKQEEKQKEVEKVELRRSALEKLEEMIAAAQGTPVRNVSVNRSQLKDDRGTDADRLYAEAERLAKELKGGQSRSADDPDDVVRVPSEKKDDPGPKKVYTGPSVLSWKLEGRRASRLPIPAYKCIGAGKVTVLIAVNNQGNVVDAKIDEVSSSQDHCLRSFALQAARLSRFSVSSAAPARQGGSITYAFIAQ
ncbi:MAG: hypothetical protein ILP18_01015 [Treponema sp.]|nr:hypothetical protein [Treponema sp.]